MTHHGEIKERMGKKDGESLSCYVLALCDIGVALRCCDGVIGLWMQSVSHAKWIRRAANRTIGDCGGSLGTRRHTLAPAVPIHIKLWAKQMQADAPPEDTRCRSPIPPRAKELQIVTGTYNKGKISTAADQEASLFEPQPIKYDCDTTLMVPKFRQIRNLTFVHSRLPSRSRLARASESWHPAIPIPSARTTRPFHWT